MRWQSRPTQEGAREILSSCTDVCRIGTMLKPQASELDQSKSSALERAGSGHVCVALNTLASSNREPFDSYSAL